MILIMTVMSSLLPLLLAMAEVHALGNSIDSFLVGHLASEAVGCEEEEGAVGRDVEARHLRLR
jgi:hypothetical protein